MGLYPVIAAKVSRMGGRPMTTGFAEKPVEFVKLHRYRMIYRIRKKKNTKTKMMIGPLHGWFFR